MRNKEQFLKALTGLEKYSNSTCKIMEVLLKLESDYRVTSSIEYLMKTTGLTKPTVYTSLKILKKDGIIVKNNNYRNTYDFNSIKMEDVINQYKRLISISNI